MWSLLLAPTTALPWRRAMWLLLAIVAGKLLWVVFSGVHVYPDSLNYLSTVWHYDYPAGYPLFLRIVQLLGGGLTSIAVVQCLLFGLGAVYLIRVVASTWKQAVLYAFVLALEPLSGFLCTSIMSEGLFLPFLMVWLGLVIQLPLTYFSWRHLMVIGVLAGLLYSVRFAMVFPVSFVVLYLLFEKRTGRMRILLPLYVVIGMQLVLVPLRLQQRQQFGTWQINGFTGANLWNNTAFLYPGSEAQSQPQGAFETHLQHFPDSVFDQERAITSQHIWDTTAPFRSYAETLPFAERWQANALAGETGMSLLKSHPGSYLSNFVWPNLAKCYTTPETIDVYRYRDRLEKEYGHTDNLVFRFKNGYWWVLTAMFLSLCVFFLFRKDMRTRRISLWLGTIGALLFVLPFVAPLNLRYLYTLAPFIVLLVIKTTIGHRFEA